MSDCRVHLYINGSLLVVMQTQHHLSSKQDDAGKWPEDAADEIRKRWRSLLGLSYQDAKLVDADVEESKPAKEVLTIERVAVLCRVAPRTVRKWFDSGRLKGYRDQTQPDQPRMVPEAMLIKFLKEHDMSLADFEEK